MHLEEIKTGSNPEPTKINRRVCAYCSSVC